MKKILTIVGTRPELIRLSEVIKKLDQFTSHIFVHTGQNFTHHLHDQFFDDLGIRKPDYQLNLQEQYSGIKFIGYCLGEIEKIIIQEKPDACLILGDTNSALSAYVCRKHHIPVFHMEAGNRCYSDEVPEEMNRKIVDSLSTYLLPYTQRSRENLLLEGYHPSKIIVTGNPITEVIYKHSVLDNKNAIGTNTILVTLHRTENITKQENLSNIITALNQLCLGSYNILLTMHPKLQDMIKQFGIVLSDKISCSMPFSFTEFLNFEKHACCVLTDSGTVPEECAIFSTPCILMRNSTERPELLENNSMILSGVRTEEILKAFEVVMRMGVGDVPSDYKDRDVSDKIVKILLRHI